jgi:purine-binding chemotaxis protein CheW
MQFETGSATSPDTVQLATFTVGDLLFGVDVTRVQEVLRYQPMTPVPQAPDVIAGLINLRGQIVIAIDMRARMQLPARAADELPMNVVVQTAEGPVSFLIDEVGEVMQMDAAGFEYPPANLNSAARQLIRGVYKLPNRLLLVLDEEQTADAATVV